MSLDTLEVLQNLGKSLHEEFAEQLGRAEQERDHWKGKAEQFEQERDAWKSKCQEQEVKIRSLESFPKVVEIQEPDHVEQNESLHGFKTSTKVKVESPVTSPVSSISSASTTRIQELERNNEILKRKYNNLDTLYREAKRQNIILKTEFEQKTEKWRGWHEWWNVQIQRFRVKSTSPAKQPNHPPQTLEAEKQLHDGKVDKNIADRQDVTSERGDADIKTQEEYFRTTVCQDVVPTRRDTHSNASPETPEIKPSTSTKRTESSKQHQTSKPNGSKSSNLVANNSMEEVQQIQDILQTTELQYLQTNSKPEIIEIPDSPLLSPHRTSLSNETRAISVELSPRPKSAPTQRSRASDSSTPLSTRTSVKKSKKRDYPNMKFFTEDGTDGINPRAPSPVESDNGGLLTAMLESPPPEAPGIAIPISRATGKQSLTTTTIPNPKESAAKAGRVRRVIELGSDSEGGKISTPPNRSKKRQKVESEPRLRRQLLSPDLASKNKGRGRYSTSFIVQNPGDPPRLGDFMIDPEKNQGVSYAFNEVVRGKEARSNLDATPCPDCVKFYRLYGSDSGAVACNHRGDRHIQQVGKHRETWSTKPVPPLFWDSDFPTEEQYAKQREEGEKRKAERVRQIAEEAARGNGRWKRKDT